MQLSHIVLVASLLCGYSVAVGEVNHPEYKPFDKSKLKSSSFFEQFDYSKLEKSGWKISHAKKDDEFSYVGKWKIESPTAYPGYDDDKGLVMKSKASHHAISYKLPEPFNNTNKDLVLQYEVKLQDGLSCGGTYIKLLDYGFDEKPFSSETPYQVMFGPDKCGSFNKIHLILRTEDDADSPLEHHLTTSPMSNTGRLSTLYTLILKKDQTFEIRINGEVAKAGSLLSYRLFDPPLQPPKEIPDPLDIKPEDWDQPRYIPDPSVEKPKNYLEKHVLKKIPDPNAEKPSEWDESEPEYVEDPLAVRPEEWDDEEDGEWIPPKIINPKCSTTGCGEWKAPLVPNPKYEGLWQPPLIANPEYKGEWTPIMIPNPDYEIKEPTNFNLIGGLGFELWIMNSDVLFDNIYLGHSIKEAECIGNKTFIPKYDIEELDYDQNKPKAEHEPKPPPKEFDDIFNEDVSHFFGDLLDSIISVLYNKAAHIIKFYLEFVSNPIGMIATQPIKVALYCAMFVFGFTFVFGVWSAILYGLSSLFHKEREEIEVKNPRIGVDEDLSEEEIETLTDDIKTSSFTQASSQATSRKT
ncbi:uncharacterized protein PRCAT00002049001 [Priceomyces carsonii]|uniref:uncharacterized protein n=1 Tax=Priceomyces carsonii TaxID=28549 RepID=UPI002EDA97FE|nr:unnamed protein product [Priceomyces carsonii]